MARTNRFDGTRGHPSALTAVVVGAGFTLTAFALVAAVVLGGHALSWPLVALFGLGAALTTLVSAIVTWTFHATVPGGPPVDPARSEVVPRAGVVGPDAIPLGVTPVETVTLAAVPPAAPDTVPLAAPAQTDVAEVSFDAQRRLLDDVRHELKTPITIVRGHLELMDPTDSADAAAIRELGIAELDRMSRLIGDIDVLASVEAGEVQIDDVHLADLTDRLFELVSVIPRHRWSVEQTADAVIRGDRDRLLQAWLQLADNAAKYTAPDSPIEVGCAIDAAATQLWVRDHGPGVAPAARHRIFRRFDRGTARRTVGGSGLGLAIVDAIAKAHGGACRVADTPGGGATFTLEIPIGTPGALPAPVRAGVVLQQREASE